MIFTLNFLIFLFFTQTYGRIITDPHRKWFYPILTYVDKKANTTKFEKSRSQKSYYQRPQDCYAYVFPYPFYDKTCTEILKSDLKCGSQTIIKTNNKIQIFKFNGNIDCYFTIQVPKVKRNEITVMSLKLQDYSLCVRGENNVEIKYKVDLGVMELCLCGTITQSFKIVSDDRFAYVFYRSKEHKDSFKFGVKALKVSSLKSTKKILCE
uniref:CUB domain-containing protein n=1 Tax=Parastrongyloides trichosuri TaxID=131310 RepID=A0A0N5A617_PARTI